MGAGGCVLKSAQQTMNVIPLFRNALRRGVGNSLSLATERLTYFVRTGYLHTGERVCPDFPNQIFENHLKVYKFLQQFVAGKELLEIGFGTGYGTALLSQTAKSIEAIDYSAQALRYAQAHYKRPNVRFQQMSAEKLSFPNHSFDMALSSEVFEHLRDHEAHVRELARVIRPGGLCFIATPDPSRSEGHNEFHTKEFPPEEMRELMSRFFSTIEIIPAMPSEGHSSVRVFGRQTDVTNLHNTHSFFTFALI
jgi:2-polyprenyl-3-methyl-5-hydroxy-6-metoxy-1,4-benzoquinol methylase